jgi:hypothetical protein
MVWLYRSPISQWGGGGYFTSNDFYLPSLSLEEGVRDQYPEEQRYSVNTIVLTVSNGK